MKKTALLLLGLAAACGPAPKPATPEPTTSGGGAAVELWAAVMKPGATFGFREKMPGDEPFPVDATVKEVTDVEGGKVATIEWTLNGQVDDGSSSLPKAITVTATDVRFDGAVMGPQETLTWPSSVSGFEEDQDDGAWQLYIHEGTLKGEVCYGRGPGKNAGECEDVCFAELCVHPTHGLTGGSGKWWPDMGEYIRRDLSK